MCWPWRKKKAVTPTQPPSNVPIRVVDQTAKHDQPTGDLESAIVRQLLEFCAVWPGADTVVRDLARQGFTIVLIDNDPNEPGALGWHTTNAGVPASFIACDPILAAGHVVSEVVSHEALETVADPACNVWRDNGTFLQVQEVCDPVEDQTYTDGAGVVVSNFVLPAYFDPFGVGPFDKLGSLSSPFSLTAGGYAIRQTGSGGAPVWGATVDARHVAYKLATGTRLRAIVHV